MKIEMQNNYVNWNGKKIWPFVLLGVFDVK